MKVVMTPNPYRDKQFRVAEQAQSILEAEGVTVRMCLPFEVDKSYPLPSGIHFYDLKKEIRDAQMLICFGGDGTILHASKFATAITSPCSASTSGQWALLRNWNPASWSC